MFPQEGRDELRRKLLEAKPEEYQLPAETVADYPVGDGIAADRNETNHVLLINPDVGG